MLPAAPPRVSRGSLGPDTWPLGEKRCGVVQLSNEGGAGEKRPQGRHGHGLNSWALSRQRESVQDEVMALVRQAACSGERGPVRSEDGS